MGGVLATLVAVSLSSAHAEPPKPPAFLDEFGVRIGQFERGRWNAITDVPGVRIGHKTLIRGNGKLKPGKGPVRTGVTVIIPAEGDLWNQKVYAGVDILNGNGEATGLMWVKESGILETPIAFTNTLNVGVVQTALIKHCLKEHPLIGRSDDTLTPIVMECDDSSLNDIRGIHVTEKDVIDAVNWADSGPVHQGAVGAGTGMISYRYKAGIGSSSRLVNVGEKTYTIGVILNANHGNRHTLRFAGHPVGEKLKDNMPKLANDGSITVVIATDAPLDSRQLSRLAKRATLGVGRTGGVATHGSGDVFLAFSTANRIPHYPSDATYRVELLSDFHIDPLFEAVADATEEAVLNSMLAARTMVGRDGNTVYELPKDCVKALINPSGKPHTGE